MRFFLFVFTFSMLFNNSMNELIALLFDFIAHWWPPPKPRRIKSGHASVQTNRAHLPIHIYAHVHMYVNIQAYLLFTHSLTHSLSLTSSAKLASLGLSVTQSFRSTIVTF